MRVSPWGCSYTYACYILGAGSCSDGLLLPWVSWLLCVFAGCHCRVVDGLELVGKILAQWPCSLHPWAGICWYTFILPAGQAWK